MRKLIALMLATVFILSLAACGENIKNPLVGNNTSVTSPSDNNNGENNNGENNNGGENKDVIPDLNFGSIMSGNGTTDTVWGKQDEATRQQIIAEGKKDGVDVSFGADGSMTVVDPENGDTIVQNPDGTWTVKNEDGTIGQYGGEWPENEFTKLLPKPEFELTGASTNEDEFAVLFQNVTVGQIKDYVEKVKANGFTVDAEITDQDVMGMVIYSYEAKNSADYTVSVTFTGGVSGLVVQKP